MSNLAHIDDERIEFPSLIPVQAPASPDGEETCTLSSDVEYPDNGALNSNESLSPEEPQPIATFCSAISDPLFVIGLF